MKTYSLSETNHFAGKLMALLLTAIFYTGHPAKANENSPNEDYADEFASQLMDPEVDANNKRRILYDIKSREWKKLRDKQKAFTEQMLRKIDESFKQKYANAKSSEERKLIDKARYKARDQFFKALQKQSAKVFEQLDQALKPLIEATYQAGAIDLSQFELLNGFSEQQDFNLTEEVLKLIFPDLAEQQSLGEVDMYENDMSENGISEDDMTADEYSDEMEEGFTEDQPSASEEDQLQSTDFESQAMKESDYNGNMVTQKFIAAIENCQVYEESFRHIFTGETLKRFIHGIKDNRCVYEEQMPNGGLMTCHYTLQRLPDIAWFYAHPEAFENMQVSSHTEFVDGKPVTTNRVTVNGKEVKHALNEALEQGECNVSGY